MGDSVHIISNTLYFHVRICLARTPIQKAWDGRDSRAHEWEHWSYTSLSGWVMTHESERETEGEGDQNRDSLGSHLRLLSALNMFSKSEWNICFFKNYPEMLAKWQQTIAGNIKERKCCKDPYSAPHVLFAGLKLLQTTSNTKRFPHSGEFSFLKLNTHQASTAQCLRRILFLDKSFIPRILSFLPYLPQNYRHQILNWNPKAVAIFTVSSPIIPNITISIFSRIKTANTTSLCPTPLNLIRNPFAINIHLTVSCLKVNHVHHLQREGEGEHIY